MVQGFRGFRVQGFQRFQGLGVLEVLGFRVQGLGVLEVLGFRGLKGLGAFGLSGSRGLGCKTSYKGLCGRRCKIKRFRVLGSFCRFQFKNRYICIYIYTCINIYICIHTRICDLRSCGLSECMDPQGIRRAQWPSYAVVIPRMAAYKPCVDLLAKLADLLVALPAL